MRPRLLARPPRWASSLVSLLAAGLVAAQLVVATPSAVATPPEGGRPLVGTAESASSPTVTLVTGDRVVLRDDGGVTFLPAPGHPDGHQVFVFDGHVNVQPESAIPAIAAGAVDPALFDVTSLVAEGYADGTTSTVPVILQYAGPTARRAAIAAGQPGAVRTHDLPSIDSVSLAVTKTDAAKFWAYTRDDASLRKVWLDARIQPTLTESVPQVHAPEAWALGLDGTGATVAVLDTGIDAEHPDLAGQVQAAQDFTGSASGTADATGHGTHVASTVAGSGGGDGLHRGVAPGADLLIGKVLTSSGGTVSSIIAGMQWAVDQHADVVQMSLGTSAPTDCKDPLAQATVELAGRDTSLFVVAAGNLGAGEQSVTSPGCVPAVLTVGAVDHDDVAAPFTSRGTTQQHVTKPEISAPGVAIEAAAAGGRGLHAYVRMSGTSMAAPHVSGAAAVLAQEHPGWPASRIKQTLVSSADPDVDGSVVESGAGRLDVYAATQAAITGPASVSAGAFPWPHTQQDLVRQAVSYANTGDTDVTLSLDLIDVVADDGTPAPHGLATLGRRQLVVPAGQSRSLDLVVRPSTHLDEGQYGDVTGRIVARGDGVRVVTPFGAYLAPQTVTLTVGVIDRNGAPAAGQTSLDVVSLQGHTGVRTFPAGGGPQQFQVEAGTVSLTSFVSTPDRGITYQGTSQAAGLPDSLTFIGRPAVSVTRDTTIVLDARDAERVRFDSDLPVERSSAAVGYGRSWDERWAMAGSASVPAYVHDLYVDRDRAPRNGTFQVDVLGRLRAPTLDLHTPGRSVEFVPPYRKVIAAPVALLDGPGSARVVDAGTGTPDELEAARGQLALVRTATPAALVALAQSAHDHGVLALVGYRDQPGRWLPSGTRVLPILSVDAATADRIRGSSVTWQARRDSPYQLTTSTRVPSQVHGDVIVPAHTSGMERVTARYYSLGADAHFFDHHTLQLPGNPLGSLGVGAGEDVRAASERVDYFAPGTWERILETGYPYGDAMYDIPTQYVAGASSEQEWWRGILRHGAPVRDDGTPALVAERQDNQIGFSLGSFWADSDPRHWSPGAFFGTIGNAQLSVDGTSLGSTGRPSGVWDVPEGPASYELRVHTQKFGAGHDPFQRSLEVDTSFFFESQRDPTAFTQDVGVMFPGYDLDGDLANDVPAGQHQIGLSVTGHAQYSPGDLVAAEFAYSYDGGTTWVDAPTSQTSGQWSALVDHTGHEGETVTTRVRLVDSHGTSVTQEILDAYGVQAEAKPTAPRPPAVG